MARNRVFCEVDEHGPIRIIKHDRDALLLPPERVRECPRVEADRMIRERVWREQNHECAKCGKLVTLKQLHVHERVFRSHGGERSLTNCWGLCYDCHEGDDGEHPGLQFGGTR